MYFAISSLLLSNENKSINSFTCCELNLFLSAMVLTETKPGAFKPFLAKGLFQRLKIRIIHSLAKLLVPVSVVVTIVVTAIIVALVIIVKQFIIAVDPAFIDHCFSKTVNGNIKVVTLAAGRQSLL